jgi:DNA polymerase-3 subunit epsilon
MNIVPAWAESIGVFDTETTGVEVTSARIVTATVALLDAQGNVVERNDWVLNPEIDIPAAASAVHGISTEVAQRTGMKSDIGVSQIIDALRDLFDRGFAVTAFNAPYDFSVLKYEALRNNLVSLDAPRPVLDPLVIDRKLDRYRRGKRTLTATLEHFGVPIAQAHDAGEDAIATGRLMQKMASQFEGQLPNEIESLHDAQISWAKEQAESFQEWMRRKDPSFVADGAWPIR